MIACINAPASMASDASAPSHHHPGHEQAAKEVFDVDTAQLWWAGKELTRGKALGDFVGRNEKTTIIAKLQKVWCPTPWPHPHGALVPSRPPWTGHTRGLTDSLVLLA